MAELAEKKRKAMASCFLVPIENIRSRVFGSTAAQKAQISKFEHTRAVALFRTFLVRANCLTHVLGDAKGAVLVYLLGDPRAYSPHLPMPFWTT